MIASSHAHVTIYVTEAQHPWHDGGRERDKAASRDGHSIAGRQEVPAGRGTGRCGRRQEVSNNSKK